MRDRELMILHKAMDIFEGGRKTPSEEKSQNKQKIAGITLNRLIIKMDTIWIGLLQKSQKQNFRSNFAELGGEG